MATMSFFGLAVTLVSCILGVLMDMFGISSLPFLMAFILTPQLEMYTRRGFSGSATGYMDFFTRPISCTFIVAGTLVFLYGIISPIIKKRIAMKKSNSASE